MKAVLVILVGLWVAAAAADAEPSQRGDVSIAPTLGTRWYDNKLDLKSEISIGLRLGMTLDRRFGLLDLLPFLTPAQDANPCSPC
ncbi:MAG: hypothetical protein ACRENN_06255 [Candidatus Eiseniibacteriota bacterium]